MAKKKLTKWKAEEMLHNPPHGKKLTEKQRKYFGAVAYGQQGLSIYDANLTEESLASMPISKSKKSINNDVFRATVGIEDFEGGNNPFVSDPVKTSFTTKQQHDDYYKKQVVQRMPSTHPELYQEYVKLIKEGKVDDADTMIMAAGGIPIYQPIPSQKKAAGPSRILDIGFKPKKAKGYRYNAGLPDKESITQYNNGGIINDNKGQWAHPGKVTKINSPNITMEGVNYPVLGISDINDVKLMQPGKNYKFKGSNVTEFPLIANSGSKIKPYQFGGQLSMNDIPQEGATQIDLPAYQPQGTYDMFYGNQYQTIPSQNNNVSNAYNRIGGINGIAQGAMAIGQGLQQSDQNQGGPSGAQAVVGQFGPWGQAISQVSQIGTRFTDKSNNPYVSAAGTAIFDPASAWTNKDLSTSDRIMGGLNPIYGGFKAAKARKEKKERQEKMEALIKRASSTEDVNANKRRYVRPEDQLVDPSQLHPTYGTGTNFLKYGGHVPHMEKGGELQTYWGGEAETISENPYLPGAGETIMFKGNSHEEGGIGMKFGKSKVEVEGGEPAVKLEDGKQESLVVFGDMKIPSYGISEIGDPKAKGKKFKNYINELSKDENKQNEVVQKGVTLVNETPATDSFDKLKISSGKAMIEGGNMKLKQIAAKKQIAASVQNAILETADELGLKSDELAKGRIKKAKKNQTAQHGGEYTIPRSKMEEYEKYGYTLDPEDSNRMFRDLQSSSSITEIPATPPAKGSEEFNKAFASARRQKLPEFTWKGKKYTTDLFQGKTKTITNPGTTSRDYIYLQDDFPVMDDSTTTPIGMETSMQQSSFPQQRERFDWMSIANAALPYFRPTDQLPLDKGQLAGERYALATNQQDPVKAQLYQPLLDSVSDISLQDQLNANQADFNAIQRFTAQNPAAQATLAAQKYSANSAVLGEQFRQNQTQRMNVFNRNRAVLNDATLKNLSILDQQFVRQSQAKSNTKAVAQAAITSIADKIARNKLENRTLGIYENLYNYRYDSKGRAWNFNPLAQFTIDNQILDVNNEGKVVMDETKVKRDKYGMIINSTDTQRVTDDNRTKSSKKSRNGGIVKAIKSI